jgi:hypothetical protein
LDIDKKRTSHVNTEAETGVLLPQAKEESARSWKWPGRILEASKGGFPRQSLDFGTLASKNVKNKLLFSL